MGKRRPNKNLDSKDNEGADAFINQVLKNTMPTVNDLVSNPPDKSMIYVFNIKIEPNGTPSQSQQARSLTQEKMMKDREPLLEVMEKGGTMVLMAELPGVDASKIILLSDGRRASIESNLKGKPYSRLVDLPSRTDPKQARARYNNGVLEVIFKKSGSYNGDTISINVM